MEIVTLNLTFNMGILVIVTKDAIRNTNQTPIFEDNLQEEIQSAQRAEKQRKRGKTGCVNIKNLV